MPFMLVDEYPPGTRANGCLTCGCQRRTVAAWRDGGERIIDLGVEVDSTVDMNGYPIMADTHGLICETCVQELASMIGYVPEGYGPYHNVVIHVKQLEDEVSHLRATITALRAAQDFLGEVPDLPKLSRRG